MNIRTLAASLAASVAAFCGYATDYYVDAMHGNDANSGLAPGEGNAMESFKALFDKYTVASGSVVHAAPGVYSNGAMSATTGCTGGYRVIVPAGVAIVADEGPEKTIIKGAPADGVPQEKYGCGTGAIRCVQLLGTDSVVKDFTLTDGHSTDYGSGYYVGAVDGSPGGSAAARKTYVVGCIITNNVAGRAAGIYRSMAIRCFMGDNRVSTTGCDVMEGGAFNCVFGNVLGDGYQACNVYGGAQYSYVNNVFYGDGRCTHGASAAYPRTLYNSVVLKNAIDGNTHFTNCVVRASKGTIGGGSVSISSDAAAKLNADWRPLRDSPCVDAGVSSYYTDNFPTAFADDSDQDYLKNPRIVGASIDIGACEAYTGAGVATNWYVDARTGDDSNDGTTPAKAHKTLTAAMENEMLISGDVVNAASGVYSNGTKMVDSRKYRVVVPAGVTLHGEGAATTVIEGMEDHVNGTEETYWCGPDAVSCVRLYAGSAVRGFTLTKGRSPEYAASSWGGAVYASGTGYGAYVVDCVLTNNFAGRGGGLVGGTAIRCRFEDNGALTTGCDIFQGRAWNSRFGNIVNTTEGVGSVSQSGPYVNCTFYGTGSVSYQSGSSYFTNIWNSVILKGAGRNVKLMNCATISGNDRGEGSFELTQEEMLLDANYVPRSGSPLIDKGSSSLYAAYLTEAAAALSKTDLAGNQRVYNGAIDMGAFEYDWRGDFAQTLKRSQVSVVSAGEGVVTNDVKSLSVPSGASIEIDWSIERDGQHTFYAVADSVGTVTVTCDGEALAPTAEGKYAFIGTKDETRRIVISCADGASAALRDFRDSGGFVISFR